MGREQKRKYAKKYGKSMNEMAPEDDKSAKKYFKITIFVVLIVGMIYLISAVFLTKEIDLSGKKDTNNSSTDANNYTVILAKNTFRQVPESYYVYFYNFAGESSDIKSALTNLGDSKIYVVNTNDALNSNFVRDTGNSSAKTIDDLIVSGPTLVKIENEEIVEYYENSEKILGYLNSL